MKGARKITSSLLACVKPVDSLHDQGSPSACASAGMERESLFAFNGGNCRDRERSVLFCSLGLPRPGEHDPHAPRGGNDCGRAAAAIAHSTVASELVYGEGECRLRRLDA
jgi:hypothetical protein